MKYAIPLISVILSGCVLNQTQFYVSNHEVSSNVSTTTSTTSSHLTKEEPVKHTQSVKIIREQVGTKCSPFVLPEAGILPTKPIFAGEHIDVEMDVDAVLAKYINELRQYIRVERASLQAAYEKWEKACR